MPRPFWPASDFPHVKKVLEEEVYLALLEELPLVPESMWVEHAEVNLKSGEASRWQEIRLCEMDDFMWSKKRCEMLPKTCAVLQRNGLFAQRLIPYHPNTDANSGGAADNDPIFSGVPGRLSLLRLSPKSALVPHSGPNNVRISFHMGVLLPPPVEIAPGVSSFTESATITVANHTVRWQRGKVMFWDDSFVHSVRNDHPTEPRVVFTGHLFKPAITSGPSPAAKHGAHMNIGAVYLEMKQAPIQRPQNTTCRRRLSPSLACRCERAWTTHAAATRSTP